MTSCPIDAADPRLVALVESYERYTGERLGAPSTLWDAPFVVVSHGLEEPPIFWYANRAALALWEHTFSDFTRMPSRESAEPDARDARERLLAEVRTHGVTRSYTGVRIAKSGRRFLIENATVWNVVDASGRRLGQAATFARWAPL